MRKWISFRVHVPALLGLYALACAAPAAATHRDCNAVEKRDADRQLHLNARDQRASIAQHLPWGTPSATAPSSNESVIVLRDYVIGYDADVRVPLWTAERVDASRLANIHRTDCFRQDPRLRAAQASTPSDYREPTYDQGHMASFANQATSVIAGNNSFIMSNMVPQTCQFNRGIWQILEGITRLWAAEHGTVYVLSGSIFDRDGDRARDSDAVAQRMRSTNGQQRVAIPSAFYKIITIRRPNNSLRTLSIMMPHNHANPNGPAALRYLTQHITSVAEIERVAGLDLFPAGTNLGESTTLWTFRGRQPGSLCHE